VGDAAVVVGIGNPMRGDDAVGMAVVDRLRMDGCAAELAVSDGDPGELLDLWEGAAGVVIVDAMSTGRPAGTVAVVDASTVPLPASMRLGSSHHMGAAEAVELGRVLGRLPGRVVVVGVEGAVFTVGAGMSEAVSDAVPVAAAAVEEALADA
jgi:hydrogenase maturation protease